MHDSSELRQKRISNIVQAARELDSAAREDFLAEICDDADMLQAVTLQLAQDGETFQEEAEEPGSEDPTVLVAPSGKKAALTFQPGDLVTDRFRVVRFIAAGGMGEVYELEDLELGEHVAAKTVRPQLASDPKIMERFRREVQLARQVTHPSVCRSYDLFRHETEDGQVVHFLTMELLSGRTLKHHILREGALSPTEALPILRQISAALTAAHAAGVVHRDLKSANVMLEPTDGVEGGVRAVVTDFGLACLERQSVAPAANKNAAGDLTVFGSFLGTPAYMAPEQIGGGEITPAADVYALGVVIFEMMAGELPFRDDVTPFDRLSAPPPLPRETASRLPSRWTRAIQRCLEPQPVRRLQSSEQVVEILTRRHPVWRLLWAAVIALLVLGGTWAVTQMPEPVRASPSTPEAVAHYQDGLVHLRELDTQAAQQQLQAALEQEADAAMVHGALAEMLALQGRNDEAREAAETAVNLVREGRSPVEESLWIEGLYHELCLPQAEASREIAIANYTELLAETQDPLRVGLRLAAVLREDGRLVEATRVLTNLRPHGETVDARIPAAAARVAAELDRPQKVASSQDEALRLAAGQKWLLGGIYLELGEAWLDVRDDAAAVHAGKKAMELFPDGDRQALAHLLVARANRRLRDESTTSQLEAAVAGFRRLEHRSGVAEALHVLALHLHTSDALKARELYENVIELTAEIGADHRRMRAIYSLAHLHQSRDRLDAARTRYEQALAAARELGHEQTVVDSLNSLGTIYHRRGQLAAAGEHYEQSLAALRRLAESGTAIDTARLALRLNNLGNLYHGQGDLAEARERFESALATQHDNVATRALSWSGLGWVLLDQGEPNEARTHFERAMEADSGLAAEAHLGIADTLLAEERLAEAERWAEQATEEFAAAERADGEIRARILYAEILIRRGRWQAAREPLAWAGGLASRSDDMRRRLRLRITKARLTAYEEANGLEEALLELQEVTSLANTEQLVSIELRSRLAHGEVALAAGRSEGRESLRQLAEDAEERGFLLLAGKARRLL